MKILTAIRDFAAELDAMMDHARTGRRPTSPRAEATKTGRQTRRH